VGGLRTPYVEVPVASYTGHLGAGAAGGVVGFKRSFSPEQLKDLYPAQADYMAKFTVGTNRMVADRWISREDADAVIEAAGSLLC
jgi:hypothetical protein